VDLTSLKELTTVKTGLRMAAIVCRHVGSFWLYRLVAAMFLPLRLLAVYLFLLLLFFF